MDGTTHINVYSKGATELGRWLSNWAYAPIEIPVEGHFDTIEGYWYWLVLRDDRLRTMTGSEAKQFWKRYKPAAPPKADPDFKDKIRQAIDTKLITYPQRYVELGSTILSLTHYYVYGGKRVYPTKHQWVIDHLTLRQHAMQEALYKTSLGGNDYGQTDILPG
jgi:hypothetical protein